MPALDRWKLKFVWRRGSGCVVERQTSSAQYWEIRSVWVLGGVWSQDWNLKELTEGYHKMWNVRLNLTQHWKTCQDKTKWGLTDWELFLDSLVGGAWVSETFWFFWRSDAYEYFWVWMSEDGVVFCDSGEKTLRQVLQKKKTANDG